jgi:hypothetical protein
MEAKTPDLYQQIPPAGSALRLAPSRAALEVLGVVATGPCRCVRATINTDRGRPVSGSASI